MRFLDQICIVTGAGSGIGRALSLALADEGAIVCASDINPDTIVETERLLALKNAKAKGRLLDVTDENAVSGYVESIAKEHGRIDLIINNAGIAIAGEARDLEVEHWRRVMDVNLMGVIYGTHAAYKIMASQGAGHIVNISSLSGLLPFPTNIPYGTSKHAVVGLSTGLRAEGERLGVKVSVVCPGFVDSNIYSSSEVINASKEALTKDVPWSKVPADVAAKKILYGIEKNHEFIVFPGYAKNLWRLYRVSANLIRSLGRRMISDFRKIRLD
tara:strand:+ start:88 stop:903 length:816 start_codon:yes stop_codon:yes gene_type:complete